METNCLEYNRQLGFEGKRIGYTPASVMVHFTWK